MTKKTCFVVMAIGDQEFDGKKVTSHELKSQYDGLISAALLAARPGLEVVRADEVATLGSVSADIVTRIMRSDYVVVDITYPNPNVYYELGLSHASRPGTIIIKNNNSPKVPFDISHHRYIGYDDTGAGLKRLAEQLSKTFDQIDLNPSRPDSQFLETAKINNFEFQDYKKPPEIAPEVQAMLTFIGSPDLLELFAKHQRGEEFDEIELMRTLAANPTVAGTLLSALEKAGVFK